MMTTTLIAGAVLAWLVLGLMVELWLALRQNRYLNHYRANQATRSTAQRATDHARTIGYNRARLWLRFCSSAWQLLLLLGWTLGGGLVLLAQYGQTGWLSGAALLAIFAALHELFRLPPRLLQIFYVEAHFGFNRASPILIVRDILLRVFISCACAAAAGLLLLPSVLAWGGFGWLLAALLAVAGCALSLWAQPRLIAPLFNRFQPLPTGSLRTRLETMVRRCGAHAESIFVMDNSKRSARANAYFSGIGRNKRIVLFDTLLTSLNEAEIEAVLAHELGHDRMGHTRRYYSTLGVLLLGGLLLLAAAGYFGILAGLAVPDNAAFWLASGYLLLPALAWPLTPWLATRLRRYEFEADAYAAQHADAQALASALNKLMAHNAALSGSDALYTAFYASHPALNRRLVALSQFAHQHSQ